MFRLKRRKGQGAIEYLFMIAAALVIILIAVRYVGHSGQTASQQGDIAQLQAQAELAKSNLISRNLWNDAYNVTLQDNQLLLKNDGTVLLNVTATHKDKYGNFGTKNLSTVYNNCMAGSEGYCYILIDLG